MKQQADLFIPCAAADVMAANGPDDDEWIVLDNSDVSEEEFSDDENSDLDLDTD